MATTPRHTGRVRLGPPVVAPAPAPAPVAPPVVPTTTPEPRRSGRVVLRRPPVEAEPVEVAAVPEPIVVIQAAPSLPDLQGPRYVGPCLRPDLPWKPPTSARAPLRWPSGRVTRGAPARDEGPEPHGPPCPLDLHPVGDLSAWGGPGYRA